MLKPQVSVVIPVCNKEEFVFACLRFDRWAENAFSSERGKKIIISTLPFARLQ